MKYLLITSTLFLTSAGGIPLDESLTQTKFIATLKELHAFKMEQLLAEINPPKLEPLDPEYVAILEDYDRRKEAFTLSHRDLQWHTVAKVMRNIEGVDERLGLIETVRSNPLWRSLPPTVAITSLNLKNWNTARTMFYELLRRAKK